MDNADGAVHDPGDFGTGSVVLITSAGPVPEKLPPRSISHSGPRTAMICTKHDASKSCSHWRWL